MDRVGCRGSEPYFRPSPASQNSEAEEKNDRGRGPHKFHCVVTARESRALAMVAEAIDGVGEAKLRKYKNDSRDVQSELVLFIDGPSHRSDRVRRAVKFRCEHIHRDADHNYLQERQQACCCRGTAFALPGSNYLLFRILHSLGLPEASL